MYIYPLSLVHPLKTTNGPLMYAVMEVEAVEECHKQVQHKGK